jgi:phenylpyruvate tautomerase PptA (4-oxalocrotonate tautomerase family)
MKTQFTLIRRHDSKTYQIAVGPDAPDRLHRRYVKSFRASREHPEIAEVHVVRSTRRINLIRGGRAPELKRTFVQRVLDVVTTKESKQNIPVKKFRTAKPKTAKTSFASRVTRASLPTGAADHAKTLSAEA